jgi:N-acetylmuramidase-like protein/putative peptidoglycan binding protein
MFSDTITQRLVAAAKAHAIEPAALLALVEVETGGKCFEEDGRTPAFLYERHVAWREAKQRGCLTAFIRAGLATPKWDRATQYKDQRSSAQRLELMRRAKAIDAETALRAASHGLGQIMGNLAERLGFADAADMVAHMTGSLDGQIDCLLRELAATHLVAPLNAHEWAHVARIYNGAGYAQNRYDVRLADAYKRWCRRLVTMDPLRRSDSEASGRAASPDQALSRDEIRAIQLRLRELGFAEVGTADGAFGTRTIGAIAAFQAHEGLPVSGRYDAATRAALNVAEPRPVARERADTSAADMKAAGSRTIAQADKLSWWGRLKIWLGVGAVAGGTAEQGGLLGEAQQAVDTARQAKGILESLHELAAPLLRDPVILVFGAVLIVAGVAVFLGARRITAARLADHRSGLHAGSET